MNETLVFLALALINLQYIFRWNKISFFHVSAFHPSLNRLFRTFANFISLANKAYEKWINNLLPLQTPPLSPPLGLQSARSSAEAEAGGDGAGKILAAAPRRRGREKGGREGWGVSSAAILLREWGQGGLEGGRVREGGAGGFRGSGGHQQPPPSSRPPLHSLPQTRDTPSSLLPALPLPPPPSPLPSRLLRATVEPGSSHSLSPPLSFTLSRSPSHSVSRALCRCKQTCRFFC